MAATVTPRSDQKRLDAPELERLLVNWQRWRVGDPDNSRHHSEESIASGLDPNRMDRAGTGMQRRYYESVVPINVRDAIAVEDAINGLPEEYAKCLITAYLLMPGQSDEAIALALEYRSRQTYYRRLDDAKVMVKSRIYGQRRQAERYREAAERRLSTTRLDDVDKNL